MHILSIRPNRKHLLIGLAVLLLSMFVATAFPARIQALSGSEFNPGRIIDDAVFFNKNAMTPAQIQKFLNSKVPVCDSYGTKMYNSTQTRAQWAAANNKPGPPYVCLKNYRSNTTNIAPES